MRRLADTVVCMTVAILLAGAWLVEPFAVVSGSMTPTLLGPHRDFNCPRCGKRNRLAADPDFPPSPIAARCEHCGAAGPIEDSLPVAAGDRVLVDRSAYVFRRPRRWEVVVFRMPHDASTIAVKRLVGLPGETIELRGGEIYADGVRQEKPPAVGLVAYWPPYGSAGPRQWTLGSDEYFVMGDNAELSEDSRRWKPGPGVPAQLLIGQAIIVQLPLRIVHWYGRPFQVPDLSAIRYIR